MRLWTIQNRSVLTAIEKGVWYSNLGYRNKEVDTDIDLQLKGRYPIYTYAMLNQDFLNINTLRGSLKDILHNHRLPRDWSDVLVEIEIAEENILHMKPVESFSYDGEFQFVSDYKTFMADIIYNCKRGESQFKYPKHLEAIISRIEGNEIVAIHEFAVDQICDTISLKTIYSNEKTGAPALSRCISMTTDGHFRIDRNKDSDLAQIKNNYRDINTLVKSKCSASMPNSDMHIYEAINFVKDDVAVPIITAFDDYERNHPGANMFNTRVVDVMTTPNKEPKSNPENIQD